jgi:protoporphyrinogen oxidase
MIGILGGGLTGLTLAYRLGSGYEVLERDSDVGGLCRSVRFDGFTFDAHGSHILFSKHDEAMNFYREILAGNLVQRRRNTKVFYKGRYVKYPFENGLADLPPEENFECLVSFLRAHIARVTGTARKPANFREWMYYKFGAGITEKYLLPYNEKIWMTDPADMGLEWVDGRVPDPPLEDIVRASLGIPTEGYTHQLRFYYPRRGGVGALTDGLKARLEADALVTDFDVRTVRREDGRWVVGDGREERTYDRLVSTIPIPLLIRALGETVPKTVREAAAGLQSRSLITVMLGVRTPRINGFSWLYFPRKEEGLFNRVSFPSNYSDGVVPKGMSSAMAEITCNPGDEVWRMEDEDLVAHVVDKLVGFGILRRKDLVASRVARTRFAYVVFDRDHRRNVETVVTYADSVGIPLVGRFGQFDYINTDQCILRARRLAEQLRGS